MLCYAVDGHMRYQVVPYYQQPRTRFRISEFGILTITVGDRSSNVFAQCPEKGVPESNLLIPAIVLVPDANRDRHARLHQREREVGNK
jgi:hypothetical protein